MAQLAEHGTCNTRVVGSIPTGDQYREKKYEWEKGLGQGGDQEPDGHSDRAPELLCGGVCTFIDSSRFG